MRAIGSNARPGAARGPGLVGILEEGDRPLTGMEVEGWSVGEEGDRGRPEGIPPPADHGGLVVAWLSPSYGCAVRPVSGGGVLGGL